MGIEGIVVAQKREPQFYIYNHRACIMQAARATCDLTWSAAHLFFIEDENCAIITRMRQRLMGQEPQFLRFLVSSHFRYDCPRLDPHKLSDAPFFLARAAWSERLENRKEEGSPSPAMEIENFQEVLALKIKKYFVEPLSRAFFL